MRLEECKKYLEHAEREWERLKKRLEEVEAELNRLTFDRGLLKECEDQREGLATKVRELEKVRDEFEQFKRKVRHPDFWLTEISEPLVDRLEEAWETLMVRTKSGRPRLQGDPQRLARIWAYRMYKLLGAPLEEKERQAIETFLVALWIWLRVETIAALYEEGQ